MGCFGHRWSGRARSIQSDRYRPRQVKPSSWCMPGAEGAPDAKVPSWRSWIDLLRLPAGDMCCPVDTVGFRAATSRHSNRLGVVWGADCALHAGLDGPVASAGGVASLCACEPTARTPCATSASTPSGTSCRQIARRIWLGPPSRAIAGLPLRRVTGASRLDRRLPITRAVGSLAVLAARGSHRRPRGVSISVGSDLAMTMGGP